MIQVVTRAVDSAVSENSAWTYFVNREWVSYRIRKIAGCACAGNARNVFLATDFKGNRQLAIPACITARVSHTCRNACRERYPPVTLFLDEGPPLTPFTKPIYRGIGIPIIKIRRSHSTLSYNWNTHADEKGGIFIIKQLQSPFQYKTIVFLGIKVHIKNIRLSHDRLILLTTEIHVQVRWAFYIVEGIGLSQ